MTKRPTFLGVTPARGGSKGIPGKNLRPIAGKPLLAWTVEAAKASRLLSRYVVSTEDPAIAAAARGLGAEVLDRPKELATDQTDTTPVLQHALAACPADAIVLLQCTSPARAAGLIDRCVEKYIETGVDSLGTVHPDLSFEYGQEMPRRQEISPRMIDNGNVYVISAETIRAGKMLGRRTHRLQISREESVEIDEPFDFWLAEKILLERRP